MTEQEALHKEYDFLLKNPASTFDQVEHTWKAALDWAETKQYPAGYLFRTKFDNGMSRLHFSQTQDVELAPGEKFYETSKLFERPSAAEYRLIQILEYITNLLTHSKPENYAEVINQCMMTADVAISIWESENE